MRSLVSADVAPDLLAVLGEALSNASWHAEATRIEVFLAVGDGINLTVIDDGRGIADHVAESGLGNMRERAHKHGLASSSCSQRRVRAPPSRGSCRLEPAGLTVPPGPIGPTRGDVLH